MIYDIIWYMIWYVWYDMIYDIMIWYMIWYDIFINCNLVVTRWQYTFTHKKYIEKHNNRTTQITTNVEECGSCPVFASFTLAFALQLRKKHEKPSVRIRKTSVLLRKTPVRVQYTYYQNTHTLNQITHTLNKTPTHYFQGRLREKHDNCISGN